MKEKKLVFNKRGSVLYCVMLFIAIDFAVYDTENMMFFISSKLIAFGMLGGLALLIKYIPSKYFED